MDRTCHSFAFSSEKKFLRKDKLTPDFELIYRLQTQKWWVFASCGSYFMAIISPFILSYPYLFQSRRYYKPVDTEDLMEHTYTNIFAPNRKESVAFSFMAVAFNAFIFILARRYALRIYFNGEKYVAVYTNGFLPLLTKNHYFERGRRTKSLLFFLPDSNYRLGNRNARLVITNFRRPIDFEKMLVTPYYEEENES